MNTNECQLRLIFFRAFTIGAKETKSPGQLCITWCGTICGVRIQGHLVFSFLFQLSAKVILKPYCASIKEGKKDYSLLTEADGFISMPGILKWPN